MHRRMNQGQGCLASLDCSMGARALCCMAVDCILLPMCTSHFTFLSLRFWPCGCGVHASVQGPNQQSSTGGRSCCSPNQEAAAAAAKQRSSSRCCWRRQARSRGRQEGAQEPQAAARGDRDNRVRASSSNCRHGCCGSRFGRAQAWAKGLSCRCRRCACWWGRRC